MAEVIVNIAVEQLIGSATEWLKEEISLVKGVKTELQNMISKMQIIQKVLEDAENQSVKEIHVKLWLDKLQDVSYDMDDALDEWNTRVLIQKRDETKENTSNEIVGSSTSPTCNFACLSSKQLNCFSCVKQFPWRRDMALRIKDINKKMNLVFSEMEQFKLVSKAVGNDGLSKIKNHNNIGRTTTSFIDESKVNARVADKDFLLRKILQIRINMEQRLEVISIVGVGGLGKTTLAQCVYNDEKVKERFENNRIWVCVSKPFDEIKVAQDILEGLKVDHTKMKNLQTLHQSIEELLSKRKFLLVLDDVWDEDFGKWERLSLCLKVGDSESKILVTTRKEEVARNMGTSKSNIITPDLISDLDCWSIMRQRVFQESNNIDNEELEVIGKEIAKKCKGLPLAAKTLGGILISKDSVEEWREVLNSETWKLEKVELELFPHILFSYQEFPTILKRCFLILALFPKDARLSVELVIQIWMAHGFLNLRTEEDEMVKTGHKYLKFLLSRAFLEEGWDGKFTMHDIIHDFALYLSGDELLSIMVDHNMEKGNSSKPISKRGQKSTKTRHSIITGPLNLTSIGFDVGRLRTCITVNVPPNVTSDLVQRLKLVRALYLKDCDLKKLPENIVKLIHLRVLYLSDNPLVELPEKIGNLYNLQQMSLERLDSLSSLPHSLGKLINLILLVPGDLALEKAPESVGKLINLQNLGRVRVDGGKRKLGLLMDLNQLRGLLEIEFKSDYADEADAKKAAIGRKKHITEFALYFHDHHVTDGVVAALQPPLNIQTLRLYGLLPSWINSLDHLSEVEVHGGKYVSTLPPLWRLQSLKKLMISKFSALEIIGREFLGLDSDPNNRCCSFKNLVKLKFSYCVELTGWEDLKPEEEDACHAINVMPKIENLEFDNCDKLVELPHRLLRQAPFLKELSIKKQESSVDFNVKRGLAWWQGDQKLEMLVNNSTKVITSINCNNSYITLARLYCQAVAITYLPPMGQLPFLESLTIARHSSLKSIDRNFLGFVDTDNDEEFVAFPNLVKLEIDLCYFLERWEDLRPDDEGKIKVMPKLEHFQITDCQNFKVLPCRLLLKLPSCLKVLQLPDGENSVSLRDEELKNGLVAALPQPAALERLRVERYKGSELPKWIIYLNNLTRLELFGAENVVSLPALGKLPSLEILNIVRFSVLKFIGREFLGVGDTMSNNVLCFPKLNTLHINNCSELKEWEDIKPEEEDQITAISNLKEFNVRFCNQLEVLPRRLLCKAASLEVLSCYYNSELLAENVCKDTELLRRVRTVYVDGQDCSLRIASMD